MLDGAANPEGAQALVDFLVGRTFQEALPDNMYVFPVDDAADAAAAVGEVGASRRPTRSSVAPAEIAAHRDDWIREWSDVTAR